MREHYISEIVEVRSRSIVLLSKYNLFRVIANLTKVILVFIAIHKKGHPKTDNSE